MKNKNAIIRSYRYVTNLLCIYLQRTAIQDHDCKVFVNIFSLLTENTILHKIPSVSNSELLFLLWVIFSIFIGPRSPGLIYVSGCHWVSNWVTELRFWNFTDVTLVDEDTNWMLTYNDKTLPDQIYFRSNLFQWHYLNWLQIWSPDGTTCISSKLERQLKLRSQCPGSIVPLAMFCHYQ